MEDNNEMSKWINSVYDHLGRYKASKMKKPYQVEFRNKLYNHILKVEDGDCNYLGDDATEESKNIKKHMYWHHLNSSQTMCINYFAPLIRRSLLSTFFKRILDIDAEISDHKFEHTPKENSTNFDFWAKDYNNKNYFFEIKYTEADVNKKTSASDPKSAYAEFYKEDCDENPLFKGHISFDTFMFKHYQAYRNMVKAKNGDYSIFITMDGNSGVTNELDKSIKDLGLTRESCRDNHILLLTWQEIIEKTISLFKELGNLELTDYYCKFREKYIELD